MWDGMSAGGGSSRRSHEEAVHSHYSNTKNDESTSTPAAYNPPLVKISGDRHTTNASFIRADTDRENPEHAREVHATDMKVGSSYLNWKELKDHPRGKQHLEGSAETLIGSIHSRHTSGSHFHPPTEFGTSEKMQGGQKIEEKSKEKDRKRKDVKSRDWGDNKKERSERNVSFPVGNSSGGWSDLPREPDKMDRDIRHQVKEKERMNEKAKDNFNVKLEPWSGVESDELLHHAIRVSDRVIKMEEPESMPLEQKRVNNSEYWRVTNKEALDKVHEKETDIEVGRQQNLNSVHDKKPDDGDGCMDGFKEVVVHGSLQRKRMHRPKGSPHISNNDSRPRCQGTETLSSRPSFSYVEGRTESSVLTYKIGDCMKELVKLWREYESSQPETNGIKPNDFSVLEIRIPAEHVSATNRQVRGGQLWGTDVYTVDSDLVAVLMHTGYCRPTASPPPPVIQELRATIRVLPPQDCYVSSLRNNVRSRAWGSAIGCSYSVENCCIIKRGGKVDLEPCVGYSSALEPTIAPAAVERTMTTRAAASNALRQQRFIREVTIQYNLCNEPWIKYSISIVADRGLKKPMYTSARLKKGEVLYLETHFSRYELCFSGEKVVKGGVHEGETDKGQGQNGQINGTDSDNTVVDLFRWSRCKKPLPQSVMRSFGVPLPLQFLEILEDEIDWEDVQWSQSGVWVAGKEYLLTRVHFLSPN